MKKFYLAIIFSLFISSSALAMDESDLAKLAAKAETDYGAIEIQNYCYNEDYKTFNWQYGDDCQCAIKAGKAKTKAGAIAVINSCL